MKENAGYTIYSEFAYGFTKIVLGVRYDETLGNRYVTWEFTESGQYYWGHYWGNEVNAANDFLQRCKDLIERSNS